jgi:hypothetical protein
MASLETMLGREYDIVFYEKAIDSLIHNFFKEFREIRENRDGSVVSTIISGTPFKNRRYFSSF